MGLALRRIKVYSKLAVVGVVAFVISAVVVKNRGNVADVWLFKSYENVPTLQLMLLTSLAAVVTWWMLWGLRRLIRDLREGR